MSTCIFLFVSLNVRVRLIQWFTAKGGDSLYSVIGLDSIEVRCSSIPREPASKMALPVVFFITVVILMGLFFWWLLPFCACCVRKPRGLSPSASARGAQAHARGKKVQQKADVALVEICNITPATPAEAHLVAHLVAPAQGIVIEDEGNARTEKGNPRLEAAKFLRDIGLKEYTPKLFELGFDSLEAIRYAQEEDVKSFMKIGHLRKFFAEVRKM